MRRSAARSCSREVRLISSKSGRSSVQIRWQRRLERLQCAEERRHSARGLLGRWRGRPLAHATPQPRAHRPGSRKTAVATRDGEAVAASAAPAVRRHPAEGVAPRPILRRSNVRPSLRVRRCPRAGSVMAGADTRRGRDVSRASAAAAAAGGFSESERLLTCEVASEGRRRFHRGEGRCGRRRRRPPLPPLRGTPLADIAPRVGVDRAALGARRSRRSHWSA